MATTDPLAPKADINCATHSDKRGLRLPHSPTLRKVFRFHVPEALSTWLLNAERTSQFPTRPLSRLDARHTGQKRDPILSPLAAQSTRIRATEGGAARLEPVVRPGAHASLPSARPAGHPAPTIQNIWPCSERLGARVTCFAQLGMLSR